MALTSGAKLGPYEILSPLGAGGMGEVYKARDTRLDRIVAIKVSNEKFSDRFEVEARAVAALNHPNICQLHDVGPNYLVMEFVDGSPVAPTQSTRKLLDVAVQIADGMAAAHAAGFVHRDLKPANVLVTSEGRVKILDFGLAKTMVKPDDAEGTQAQTITKPGEVAGTAEEGRFFHGYYGDYCYLPLYIFCGQALLCARLRVSNIDASAGCVEELQWIVKQVREAWPGVKITLRGDSGFCREELMKWCEEEGIDYVLGLAKNDRLKAEIVHAQEEAAAEYQQTGKAARRF